MREREREREGGREIKIDGWKDGRMDGRMDGWTDGWTDGWMSTAVWLRASHRMRVGLWREQVYALHSRAARDGPMGFAAPSSSGGTERKSRTSVPSPPCGVISVRVSSAAVSPGRFGAVRARLRAGAALAAKPARVRCRRERGVYGFGHRRICTLIIT